MMGKKYKVFVYCRNVGGNCKISGATHIDTILCDSPEAVANVFKYHSDGEKTAYTKDQINELCDQIKALSGNETLHKADYVVSVEHSTKKEIRMKTAKEMSYSDFADKMINMGMEDCTDFIYNGDLDDEMDGDWMMDLID